MSTLRKKFTRVERLEIVKQSFGDDAVVSSIATKFGISASTLSRWRQEYRAEHDIEPAGQGSKIMTDEERQIAQLKRQLREAQLERDILKKAIGIFSENDRKSTSS